MIASVVLLNWSIISLARAPFRPLLNSYFTRLLFFLFQAGIFQIVVFTTCEPLVLRHVVNYASFGGAGYAAENRTYCASDMDLARFAGPGETPAEVRHS